MPVTDPIADMLVAVKNGVMAQKESVIVKGSGLNENILEILKEKGFILNYKTVDDKRQGTIKVYLKYGADKRPALTGLKRISKPGLRIYVKSDKVKSVYGGIGIAIISTSKGVVADKEAREKKVGGEILCEVW